jgi:hypothetical protein
MAGYRCPNCGNNLTSYKTDRQSAGEREVVLQWAMCERCSHVALRDWSFSTPEPTVGRKGRHAAGRFEQSASRGTG